MMLRVYFVLLLGLIYLPVLMIPLFSVNDSPFVSFPIAGLTLDWYRALFANAQMLAALRNSLFVAAIVSIASTTIGLLAATALTDRHLRRRGILTALLSAPILMPGLLLGIALLIFLRRVLGIELSLLTIGIGHLALCSPFSLLVILSRLDGLNPDLIDAARDLGLSEGAILRRVIVPLCWPALAASVLLCLTLSFDEFVVSFFLSGVDVTLPVYIYSQLRFPNAFPTVLALGTLMILASAALVALAEILRRRQVK